MGEAKLRKSGNKISRGGLGWSVGQTIVQRSKSHVMPTSNVAHIRVLDCWYASRVGLIS